MSSVAVLSLSSFISLLPHLSYRLSSVSSFPSPRLPASLEKLEGDVLFQQSKITEVLGGSGYNTDRLATPYIPQFTDEDRLSKRKSIGETISLQVEVESRNSPEKEERTPAEEITFETLKNAIGKYTSALYHS
ncbi:unnamed protein product [Oncorhynchus mykiss]|uniref:Uncharacterized protein n=1 Tax=Oncorhynchus mykiss TaxID=8022 RepID=A0A060YD43_ONCMY|nr:unnamed protein product [Oncorhynchus mykiss]